MGYSKLQTKISPNEDRPHLTQGFSEEEWNDYPFANSSQLEWFRNGKIGLFLHVGISSIGKVDIGWPRHTHKLPDPGAGNIPDEVYDGWSKEIEFKDFNAKHWIQLAVDGGFKYVVIITKHHDGFHMWDTEFSDYKITHSPFRRDYIKELIEACHEVNMKVGLYYSQRDWVHPYYEPIDPNIAKRITQPPFYELNPGETLEITGKHKKYIEYLHNTVRELMTKYGKIDILWWDACWFGNMFLEKMWDADAIEREVRRIQPDILINNRASLPGDFDTPECVVGMFQNDRPWETCMPLGAAWAWTGEKIKSFKTVIKQFINCICGDGNYLLSIGGMSTGDFDTPEKERIHQLGRWLKAYGESVYGTRGGPWLSDKWGGSTYRENTIYLHVLECNDSETIMLPLIDNPIVAFECLTGEEVLIKKDSNHMIITIDKSGLHNPDIIIKLSLENKIEGIIEGEAKIMDAFSKNLEQYGKPIIHEEVFCLNNEDVLEIPRDSLVTGVFAEGVKGINIRISTSEDKINWDLQYEGVSQGNSLEATISRYEAGADICGKKCRYIKIASTTACELFGMKIYAKYHRGEV